MTRRFRFLTSLIALLAMLLSSAALAGYACPGREKAVEIAQMVEAGIPCAETMSRAMDDEQPALCHAHCQSGDQSADSFHPPAFFDPMQMGAVLEVAPAARPVEGRVPDSVPLRRPTGPPLAVRYCCFQI